MRSQALPSGQFDYDTPGWKHGRRQSSYMTNGGCRWKVENEGLWERPCLGQCALNRHAKGTKWYCFMSCNRQITGGHTSAITRMKGCGLNSKCKSKFLL